jgi:hypothetical protein
VTVLPWKSTIARNAADFGWSTGTLTKLSSARLPFAPIVLKMIMTGKLTGTTHIMIMSMANTGEGRFSPACSTERPDEYVVFVMKQAWIDALIGPVLYLASCA